MTEQKSSDSALGDGNVHVVCIKAFGDLVIAVSSIDAIDQRDRSTVRLMIGSHLRPLATALNPPVQLRYLDHPEAGVPSLFDIRKNGVFRAMNSARNLRTGARKLIAASTGNIFTDKVDARIRFILGKRVRPLPANDNIYQAYQALFSDLGLRQTNMSLPGERLRAGEGIGIFPGSRIAAKNLPLSTIADVLTLCDQAGRSCRIILLEGERPDVEASGLPHHILPRSFDALINAVAACERIISADSLPAHLAEREAIPVFVLSPVDNSYWLPLSALRDRACSLISGDEEGQSRLAAFVQGELGHAVGSTITPHCQ